MTHSTDNYCSDPVSSAVHVSISQLLISSAVQCSFPIAVVRKYAKMICVTFVQLMQLHNMQMTVNPPSGVCWVRSKCDKYRGNITDVSVCFLFTCAKFIMAGAILTNIAIYAIL